MSLSVGNRVIVLRNSTLAGRFGSVTKFDRSGVWVLLDGDRLPMAFATFEVVTAEESSPHITAGD